MDMATKQNFMALWEKYFNKAELPITMINNMEESFLITPSWRKVQSRIN